MKISEGLRVYQEAVALFGAIAVEGVCAGQLVHGAVHRLDAGRRKRTGDVADAQAYQFLVRVGHLEGIDTLGNVGKEITALQFQEVFVY